MKKCLIVTAVLVPFSFLAVSKEYTRVQISDSDRVRAEKIVSTLTLEEKCRIISGVPAKAVISGFQEAGAVKDQNTLGGVPAKGIPEIYMADGPQGINNKINPSEGATYYACGISAAASFDRDAVIAMGDGLGMDALSRGVGFLLGPGTNIYRSPLCGRNFEYFGEDPYLAGEVAVCYVLGVQSHGVISTIKHFAANGQEWDRFISSANIDERTLHEIYLEPFRKAVQEGGIGSIMTACGRLNDVPCAQNPYLLRQTLRDDWGFRGISMCDWQTTYSTLNGIRGGLDVEMPNPFSRNYERVKKLVDNGVLRESEIDEHCINVVQTLSAFGLLDRPLVDPSVPSNNPYCHKKAYEAAVGGPVLVKNNGLLPLASSKKKEILITGRYADTIAGGGGSGRVTPFPDTYVSTFKGLQKLGSGYKTIKADIPTDDQIRNARAVIVEVGFGPKLESENHDHGFSLPMDQEELLERAVSLSDKVVVIIHSGCEVDMRGWGEKAAAIIYAWYGGEHTGTVLSEILAGKISPSGRLPFTMWGSFENNPAAETYFADKYISYSNRTRFSENPHVDYKEGVFLGYRGIEKFGRKPLYPFGYGLSYSTFSFYGLKVTPSSDGFDVTFTIKNTGKMEAAQVAQVYVAPVNPSLPRPVRELKQFTKVKLPKSESKEVSLHLPLRAFAHFDVPSHSWIVDKGAYNIQIGDNSQNVIIQQTINL